MLWAKWVLLVLVVIRICVGLAMPNTVLMSSKSRIGCLIFDAILMLLAGAFPFTIS